jgi:dGTPase
MLDSKRTFRERYQEFERLRLSPKAMLSAQSRGRCRPEEECALRTPFQRDRDRILHSKAFRRLKRKTQVFISPLGDHYRTRLTHTLEVAQIARTMARALQLNEDLVEAIALGHDLGHTPFGHAGEAILDKLLAEGFRHYRQSLRVVEVLECEGQGLNLTWEVRDGILKHSKGMGPIVSQNPDKIPATLEGQVVRVADVIAYVNHDLDDAVRAGLLNANEIPQPLLKALGDTHSARINTMVVDVIETSETIGLERICMSEERLASVLEMRAFLDQRVYSHANQKKEFEKAEKLLTDLFGYLIHHPEDLLAAQWLQRESVEKVAVDFLAGMTDSYAVQLYEQLFIPQAWMPGRPLWPYE